MVVEEVRRGDRWDGGDSAVAWESASVSSSGSARRVSIARRPEGPSSGPETGCVAERPEEGVLEGLAPPPTLWSALERQLRDEGLIRD